MGERLIYFTTARNTKELVTAFPSSRDHQEQREWAHFSFCVDTHVLYSNNNTTHIQDGFSHHLGQLSHSLTDKTNRPNYKQTLTQVPFPGSGILNSWISVKISLYYFLFLTQCPFLPTPQILNNLPLAYLQVMGSFSSISIVLSMHEHTNA